MAQPETTSNPLRRRRRIKEERFCRICGEVAANFNFGVLTCEACKAFFRRNASLHEQMKCAFDGKCFMMSTKKSRRRCSACRLKVCFEQGMSCDFLRRKKKAQADEESSGSCTSWSPGEGAERGAAEDPAGLHLPFRRRPCDVDLAQYKLLGYADADVSLSASQLAEVRALGKVLGDLMSEPAPFEEAGEPLHLPPFPDSSWELYSWSSILMYSDAIIRRLLIFIRNLKDLSGWNLKYKRLPFVKMRLPIILIPLYLPSYSEKKNAFVTIINGRRILCYPHRLQEWLWEKRDQYQFGGLLQLSEYVGRLYSLLGNNEEMCALYCCMKLFLVSESQVSKPGCSNVLVNMDGECLEFFENYLFEISGLLRLHFPEDYSDKISHLLDLLVWSQKFDQDLANVILNVPITEGSAMPLVQELRGND